MRERKRFIFRSKRKAGPERTVKRIRMMAGQKLAEIAKMSSREAFYTLDDLLEAQYF
jgi:hypothetical protein